MCFFLPLRNGRNVQLAASSKKNSYSVGFCNNFHTFCTLCPISMSSHVGNVIQLIHLLNTMYRDIKRERLVKCIIIIMRCSPLFFIEELRPCRVLCDVKCALMMFAVGTFSANTLLWHSALMAVFPNKTAAQWSVQFDINSTHWIAQPCLQALLCNY